MSEKCYVGSTHKRNIETTRSSNPEGNVYKYATKIEVLYFIQCVLVTFYIEANI